MGGTGKAARNHKALACILNALKSLGEEETLLVQSGKPVGILKSHKDAPRVLIANSNIVPAWADWEHFREYEKMGLTMYGQMTAGSWIYIGSQGILQGTYLTFSQAAKKWYGGDLKGKFVLSAGLGGMGGAQPLAAKMNGGIFLGIEIDPRRIEKRLESGYVDCKASSLEDALERVKACQDKNEAISIALEGNAATIYQEMVDLNHIPDMVTDQTLRRLFGTFNQNIRRG